MKSQSVNSFIGLIHVDILEEISESKTGSKEYKVRLIQPGLTKSANAKINYNGKIVPIKKDYKKEAIQKAVSEGIFEMIPVILRDEKDHLNHTNDSIKNSIGTVYNVSYSEEHNGAVGTLRFKPGSKLAQRFKEKVAEIYGGIKNFGLSIVGQVDWDIIQKGTDYIAEVKEILKVDSVDPCFEGNAGGQILDIAESTIIDNKNNILFLNHKKNYGMLKLTPEQKKSLFDFLNKKNKIPSDKTLETISNEELLGLTDFEELKTFLNPEPAKEPDPKKEPAAKDPDPVLTPEEATKIKEAIAEFAKMQREQNFRKIISESKLSKDILDPIEKRYSLIGFDFKEEFLKDELKQIAETFSRYQPKLPIVGGGWKGEKAKRSKFEYQLDSIIMPEYLIAALPEEERKLMAEACADMNHRSIREFYKSVTGDIYVSGHYDQSIAESISSDSLATLFGNTLNRYLQNGFNQSAYTDSWKKFTNIINLSDFKTNTLTGLGGYGTIPTVAERGAYTYLTTPTENAMTFVPAKYGGLESISFEAIKNDDTNTIARIPLRLIEAAVRTCHAYIMNLFIGNPTMYDSKALFHADHNNIISGTLDENSLILARKKMYNQTERDSNAVMGINGKYIVTGIENEKIAYELTKKFFGTPNASAEKFVQTFNLEPIIIPEITGTETYIIADRVTNPGITVGFLDGKVQPEILMQDDPKQGTAFTNDVINLKLRHIYGGVVEDYKIIQKISN